LETQVDKFVLISNKRRR